MQVVLKGISLAGWKCLLNAEYDYHKVIMDVPVLL